jgi:hypothetical protein
MTFVVAAATAGACAAILGIEDRVLMEKSLVEGGEAGEAAPPIDADMEDAGDDAPFVISVIPDASCDAVTCGATGGGACVKGACQIVCGGGCAGKTITCPPDTDCQVVCDAKNGCNAAKCTGGRSCTFECATTNCVGASCDSDRCSFRCGGGSCGKAACDAAVSCEVYCEGASSCDVAGGIHARAGESCSISCTGQSSCGSGGGNGAGSPIRCDAPDAAVTCGAARDTCKDGIPTCNGASCTVSCLGTDSCEDGYCCDAGQCVKNGTPGAKLCN